MGKYDDIIGLPRPRSKAHPPMPLADRAAQFSPFAALTGYEAAIAETARLTDDWIEPGEADVQTINDKIVCLMEHLPDRPEITVLYFLPDERKAGGQYVSAQGRLRRIRTYEQEIELQDGHVIPIGHILSIESEIFGTWGLLQPPNP